MVARIGKRETVTRWVGPHVAGWMHAFVWAKRMPRFANPATWPIDHCLLHRFVKLGDVCLDIGVHGGSWTYPLAKRVGPSGYVHAFEAFPYYAKTLERALWLRRLGNVKTHSFALGDADGEHPITLVDGSGNVLSGRIHLTTDEETPTERMVVSIRKLDTVMSQNPALLHPTFVKIDVEGAELAVFRGARRMLEDVRPVIYCEIVDTYCRRYGHQLVDVLDHLARASYRPFALTGDCELTLVDRHTETPPHDFVLLPDP